MAHGREKKDRARLVAFNVACFLGGLNKKNGVAASKVLADRGGFGKLIAEHQPKGDAHLRLIKGSGDGASQQLTWLALQIR